jgi:hypothetical protein
MSKKVKDSEPHIELERKYRRILSGDFKKDAQSLRAIFEFVNRNVAHYVYVQPEENIDPELLSLRQRPMNFKQARRRTYWANKKLSGYNEDDRKDRLEIRTERKKNGVTTYDIDVKRGGPASEEHPTMRRDEESRKSTKGLPTFRGFPKYMKDALKEAFGKPSKLKPVVYIDSYTAVMKYHPDGREDVTLEIKFDTGKGFNFMGYQEPVIEFEIEIKELPADMSCEDVQAIWRKEEAILNEAFEDIERIYDSKPSPLFYDLVSQKEGQGKAYGKAWDALDKNWMDHPRPKA